MVPGFSSPLSYLSTLYVAEKHNATEMTLDYEYENELPSKRTTFFSKPVFDNLQISLIISYK